MVAFPAMRYIVVRKQNTEALKQFKIVAPVITIGRTSENSIALKDGTVSRQEHDHIPRMLRGRSPRNRRAPELFRYHARGRRLEHHGSPGFERHPEAADT